MMASPSSWVKFFQAAGVPSSAAATYAHIFYENRMKSDMLMDLNNNNLREMGITPMGDIIAILRHAKNVHEQNAREKILSGDKQSSATSAIVNPLVVPVAANASKVIKLSSRIENGDKPKSGSTLSSKPARRVLPEHEGRYKITLPSGTTERSKEILAKRAMLYADKEEEKKGIFDRLQLPKSDLKSQKIKVTGLGKPMASIFSRLGGKDDADEIFEKRGAAVAGILKSSPKKLVALSSIKKPSKQKVILVKKIPAKAATMVADEYDSERMETGEKSVSFSSEDEILEIESRRMLARQNKGKVVVVNKNVRARLGARHGQQQTQDSASAILHRTKKTIKLKATSSMKSDEMALRKSVKSRLNIKGSSAGTSDVKKLTNRIGRVSIEKRAANGKSIKSNGGSASSSVFDRLGFNKI